MAFLGVEEFRHMKQCAIKVLMSKLLYSYSSELLYSL